MATETIRIGSRGSELALWQAHWVRDRLNRAYPDARVELVIIKTTGDKILDAPLSRIGDKGLFTREIERALLDGGIDLAVHSLKDLPTQLPDGLVLGAVTAEAGCQGQDAVRAAGRCHRGHRKPAADLTAPPYAPRSGGR